MSELPKHVLLQAVNQLVMCNGNATQAARELNVPRSTFRKRVDAAAKRGIKPTEKPVKELVQEMTAEEKNRRHVKRLESIISELQGENLSAEYVREKILSLSKYEYSEPNSFLNLKIEDANLGVPTIFLSDWHWGEKVSKNETAGYNEYNRDIAVKRLAHTVESSINVINDLVSNHDNLPGIVVALGGDMVSGDIHEELANTNDATPIEAVNDILDHLIWAIESYEKAFGKVFVPCAFGNHGRSTKKPRFKMAAQTNYDWLIYQILEKHFRNNENVKIASPLNFDLRYKVYNTRYLLTHGDRLGVKGGDGIIGPIGPITRGVKKLRDQYSTVGNPVDCVIMGHWHNSMYNESFIVNGCGKGYDEYAIGNRFNPSPPTQNLWFTHPVYGINNMMKIYAEKPKEQAESKWISF